jgi:glycerophosphoryl diester phosphodiesterase
MVVKIAHRGASKFAPENTLPAFEKAIDMGMDYIEIDVRATSDGILVLSHDSTVDRMTNGTGRIEEMKLDRVKALDASAGFDPNYPATEIPTLDETLGLCRGRTGIYVDLKKAPVPHLVDALERFGMVKDAAVYSGLAELIEIKNLRPDLAVMPGPGAWLSIPGIAAAIVRNLPAEVIDSNVLDWTRERVEEVHRAGGRVWVDTLGIKDNREGMLEALDMGVDGISTDHPDVLLRVLEDVE